MACVLVLFIFHAQSAVGLDAKVCQAVIYYTTYTGHLITVYYSSDYSAGVKCCVCVRFSVAGTQLKRFSNIRGDKNFN